MTGRQSDLEGAPSAPERRVATTSPVALPSWMSTLSLGAGHGVVWMGPPSIFMSPLMPELIAADGESGAVLVESGGLLQPPMAVTMRTVHSVSRTRSGRQRRSSTEQLSPVQC